MKNFITKNKQALIIAGLAILVRIVYLIQLSGQPDFAIPMVDEKFFWLQAQQIANGTFSGPEVYFRAPLYGYFLAALYWLTSGSIFWMKFIQLFLCGMTAFFIFQLAKHLFNNKVALIAGAIYALYGTLLFYEAMFLIPVLFLPLVVWGMYRFIVQFDNHKIISWIITGLIFGLAAIARPNILIVIPFLMLWQFYKADGNFIHRARRPLLLFLGLIIPILPVTVRNYQISSEFILISSQGGINLYLGNNPESDGLTMLMPEFALDESVGWDDFERLSIKAAEDEAGQSLTPSQASSFWSKKAINFALNNPGKFISLVYKKTIYLLSGFENSDNEDIYYARNKSILYSILTWHYGLFFPFGLLLPLALGGIYLNRKNKFVPLYIFIIAYIPSIVLFLVTARHRLPLIPFLIIFAGAGIYKLVTSWKSLEKIELAKVGLIILAPLVIFNFTFFDESSNRSSFQTHLNNGIKFEQLGDLNKAEEAYLLAKDQFAGSKTLYNNLGHVQFSLKKYSSAKENYLKALDIDNKFVPAINNLALLYKAERMPDTALILFRQALSFATDKDEKRARITVNFAEMFEQAGQPDSAMFYHKQILTYGKTEHSTLSKSAAYFARQKMFAESDELFQQIENKFKLSTSDLFNWGVSSLNQKNYSTAEGRMRLVIEANPDLFQAYHVIAVCIFESVGASDSTLFYVNKALAINSTYGPSLNLQDIVSR